MWTGPAEQQFQPFEQLNTQNDEYVVTDDEIEEYDDQPTVATNDAEVNYLVGILDEPYLSKINDKVRCFIYEQTRNGGYRIAMSADSSCRGLINVRKDGFRRMHLKPGSFSVKMSVLPALLALITKMGYGGFVMSRIVLCFEYKSTMAH